MPAISNNTTINLNNSTLTSETKTQNCLGVPHSVAVSTTYLPRIAPSSGQSKTPNGIWSLSPSEQNKLKILAHQGEKQFGSQAMAFSANIQEINRNRYLSIQNKQDEFKSIIDKYIQSGNVHVDTKIIAPDFTILHFLTAEGYPELVKYVAEMEPDPNISDRMNNTPLHKAMRAGAMFEKQTLEDIETLIQRGADLNAKNEEGDTPLDVAFKTILSTPIDSNYSIIDKINKLTSHEKFDLTIYKNLLKHAIEHKQYQDRTYNITYLEFIKHIYEHLSDQKGIPPFQTDKRPSQIDISTEIIHQPKVMKISSANKLTLPDVREKLRRGDKNFEGTDLEGLDLSGKDLNFGTGCNFKNANMKRVILTGQYIEKSDFSGADLQYAHLNHAWLRNNNFTNVNMNDANANSALLYDCNLNNTEMQRIQLIATNLNGVYHTGTAPNIANANALASTWGGSQLDGLKARGINLTNAEIGIYFNPGNTDPRKIGVKASWRNSDLRGSTATSSGTGKTNFTFLYLEGSDISGCEWQKIELPHNMQYIIAENANLSGSDAHGLLDLTGATLTNANLSYLIGHFGMNLNNAILNGTDLRGNFCLEVTLSSDEKRRFTISADKGNDPKSIPPFFDVSNNKIDVPPSQPSTSVAQKETLITETNIINTEVDKRDRQIKPNDTISHKAKLMKISHSKKLTVDDVREQLRRGDKNFEGADLEGLDLSGKDLQFGEGCIFRNAKMKGVILKNQHIEKSDFSGADLQNAILEGAWLKNSNFTGADLTCTDLSKLKGCEGMNFTGAVLKGTNLKLNPSLQFAIDRGHWNNGNDSIIFDRKAFKEALFY